MLSMILLEVCFLGNRVWERSMPAGHLLVGARDINTSRRWRKQEQTKREVGLWCSHNKSFSHPMEVLRSGWPCRVDRIWGKVVAESLHPCMDQSWDKATTGKVMIFSKVVFFNWGGVPQLGEGSQLGAVSYRYSQHLGQWILLSWDWDGAGESRAIPQH